MARKEGERSRKHAPGTAGLEFLSGGGEMGERIRAFDWASTPIGPRNRWPVSLRTVVGTLLASQFPMALLWGPKLILIYNDAYRVICGNKHPAALGNSTREVWSEVWHINEPIFAAVMERGEALHFEDKLFPVNRHGHKEDALFTLCYSPVRLEDGSIGGTLVVLQETTERKRAEEALRESEEKCRSLFENMTEMFQILEPILNEKGNCTDFRYIKVNRATEALTGKKREEIEGKTARELWRTVEDHWFEMLGRVLKTSEPVHMIDYSAELDVYYDAHAWKADERRVAIIFSNITEIKRTQRQAEEANVKLQAEITERKQAEEAMRESEKRFRVAQELSPNGFSIQRPVRDAQGRVTDFTCIYVNPALERMVGLPQSALVGHRLRELPGGESLPIFELYKHVAETGQTRIQESQVDGAGVLAGRWFRLAVVAMGQDIAVHSEDITPRKRAEEALRESESRAKVAQAVELEGQRLYAVLETMPAMVCLLTPDYRVAFANRSFRERFGEAQGRHCYEQCFGLSEPCAFCETYHVLKTGRPHHWEAKQPDGSLIDVHDFPFTDADGAPMILEVDIDITKFRQTQAALKEANDRLEERTAKLQEAVGELEHFSYSITHDMRAPLRAMRGFTGMLLAECGGSLAPAHRDYLQRIAVAAHRMDRLIVDALDYSKALRQELPLMPIDPEALCRGMIASYPAFQPPQARIQIEGKLPLVLANEAGLTQCFSNLLNNAVKFVEPGKVPQVRIWAQELRIADCGAEEVRSAECGVRNDENCERRMANGEREAQRAHDSTIQRSNDVTPPTPPPSTSSGRVRIWFEDNGIGIPKEYQERIFGMFQRLNNEYEGTGIGLALVRKVAERMRGNVGVESEPGQGSRFWLDLQSAQPKAQPQ